MKLRIMSDAFAGRIIKGNQSQYRIGCARIVNRIKKPLHIERSHGEFVKGLLWHQVAWESVGRHTRGVAASGKIVYVRNP